MTTETLVRLPVSILCDPWLRDAELRVWCVLRHSADSNLETRMTSAAVAELLKVDQVTVRTAIGGLIKAGYIERVSLGGSPRRRLVVP